MDELKRILDKILKSTPNFDEGMTRIQIYESWSKIVGDRIAKHCWPVALFDDGTLIVAAESNVWLQSLRYLERQILDKVNAELAQKSTPNQKTQKVKQLRFKLQMPNDREWKGDSL